MGSRAIVAGLLCLGACGTMRPGSALPASADWRRVVTPADMERLHQWRVAFVSGLDAARLGGKAADVRREGALLQPDAALDNPAIPGGRYRCRVIKLGARAAGTPTFVAYPAFDCVIDDEGEVASFAKTSGSQRPVGLVFDADGNRRIFLGTMMLSDERNAIEYGRDATRDMVGAIERIGLQRWRLILPYPGFESTIDVIELVPTA